MAAKKAEHTTRRCRAGLLSALTALLFVLLTVFSRSCAEGARLSLERCAATLIPSLFPFLVLCGFAVRSGFSERCGRFLAPLTQRLFCLPGCSAAVILMALIGGYPVGARGVRSLFDHGAVTAEEAERMMCFCVGAGPGFVAAAVGEGIFHSTQLGLILWAAQVLSALILGIAAGVRARGKEKIPAEAAPLTKAEPAGQALVASVADSAQAMLILCAFVVLFGAFLGLCSELRLSALLAQVLAKIGVPVSAGLSLLPMLLEVCSGTAAAACAGKGAVFLTAFALGWGGICVHFQIFSALGGLQISRARFFRFRFLHGLLAGGLSVLFAPLLPGGSIAVGSGTFSEVQTAHGVPLTLALLLMIFVFLLSMPSWGVEICKEK